MTRLRIISGEYGGRYIKAPAGRTTHPMGDRVRSALFNMIDVEGKRVLDAYAGSGAVGLEALSRGAAEVDFVENNKQAQRVIAGNIDLLGVENRAKMYKVSVKTFISEVISSSEIEKYDVIFVDPPYHLLPKEFSTVFELKSAVKNKGLMILSYPERLCVPTVNGVVVVDNRKYGEAALAVFRHIFD
jgi:RNA methyltransferase, RsmD family